MNTRTTVLLLACALSCAAAGTARAGGLVQKQYRLADFSAPLTINNRYFALAPGRHIVFYEVAGDECDVNDFYVTGTVKQFTGPYAGQRARLIRDRLWIDKDCDGGRDVLHEDTYDWFAQDNSGNVWYFGEDTTEYLFDDNGNPVGKSKEGSWQAGIDGATAGIAMLAHPADGQYYREEYYAGVAEDWGKVIGTDVTVTTGLGTFVHCVTIKDWTPLDSGSIEQKTYCPRAGLVLETSKGGGSEAVDLGLP
jgi:hypothetical protein